MSKLFAQLRCLFLIGLVSVSGIAGGALAVAPIFAAQDNITGLPLAGGLLYTYASGTNTYLPVYTSAALTTQMPQPIVLNNYGEAQFWLGSSAYRFNLVNAAGVQQSPYPIDNIQANASMTNLASTVAGSDGAGQIGYTLGSHSASTVGSALDTAAALETALPLNTLATNGAGLMGWASGNAYAAGTAGAGLNTLNVFDTNLGLSTLASNGAGLVGYSSGNSYTTGTVGYALNNFSIGSNFNKINLTPYTDASPALGDMWMDSTQLTLCTYEGSSGTPVKLYKSGALTTMKTNNSYTVTCTTAGTFTYDFIPSTNFLNTFTLPSNFWTIGKTIKLEMWLQFTTTTGASGSISTYLTVGGVTMCNIYTPTGGLPPTASYTAKIEVCITCTAVGASGTAKAVSSGNITAYSQATGGAIGVATVATPVTTGFQTTAPGAIDLIGGFQTYNGVTVYIGNVLITVLA